MVNRNIPRKTATHTFAAGIAGVGAYAERDECGGCHGTELAADEVIAEGRCVVSAIDATNEMVVIKSVITDEQIPAVAAYVGRFGSTLIACTLAKRGRFLPAEIGIRPGAGARQEWTVSFTAPTCF
jgi:hypothetical protein